MTTLVRHGTIVDTEIEVDSLQWFDWLKSNYSFRYQCELGNITLVKDRLYWTAAKKVDGRLRRKRAGKDAELTKDKLRALTALLCFNGLYKEYLREKSERERETKKGLKQTIEILSEKLERERQKVRALEEKLLSVTQGRL